jgi:hypothetical protein
MRILPLPALDYTELPPPIRRGRNGCNRLRRKRGIQQFANQAVAFQISDDQSHLLSDSARRGKIVTLLRAHKANGGDHAKKLLQFLNEIGARALKMHLGRVLEMAESSPHQRYL